MPNGNTSALETIKKANKKRPHAAIFLRWCGVSDNFKINISQAAVEPLDSLLEVKRRAGCDIGTEDRTEGHQDLQADKRERDEQSYTPNNVKVSVRGV